LFCEFLANKFLTANAALIVACMGVMGNTQSCFVRTREIGFGSSATLEASIQSASPAHRVLANSISEEIKAIHTEIVASFSVEIFGRINLSVDFLFDFFD
jgi:hypothetical protein